MKAAIVGTVIYSQDSDDPRIVNLELIAVREKYRLRQVGTQLIEIVKKEARLLGAIQLQTQAPENARLTELLSSKWILLHSHERERGRGFVFAV